MPPSDSLRPIRQNDRPRAVPAPFPPLVEQAILFGMVATAALFWIAVIWVIVR
jgi:hypothetical protein